MSEAVLVGESGLELLTSRRPGAVYNVNALRFVERRRNSNILEVLDDVARDLESRLLRLSAPPLPTGMPPSLLKTERRHLTERLDAVRWLRVRFLTNG
jgi:hypothetical protein